MRIRNLELKDATLMLEWMHDEKVVEYLQGKFRKKTIDDCKSFIVASENKKNNIHLAIVNDEDEYMGTVSLKNIDRINASAEFAITVRRCAMGRGYSWYGMEEIIDMAFNELGLESVYWCVSRKNKRAVRFYDKHNFHENIDISPSILQRYNKTGDLKWYSTLKGDMVDERVEVAGCKIIHIKTIPTLGAGELSFFENLHDIPFKIRRIYYISKVPEGVRRGFHAHKNLKQLLFCPYGRIQIILENKNGREEIELSDPSIGIVIEEPTWREMVWLQKESVLCVAASEYYEESDYIRNYEEFTEFVNNRKLC